MAWHVDEMRVKLWSRRDETRRDRVGRARTFAWSQMNVFWPWPSARSGVRMMSRFSRLTGESGPHGQK